MRRLLLTALLASVPAVPAYAGPATCTVVEGVPVCAGTCAPGDTLTVRVTGAGSGTASCGGTTVTCFATRGTCTDSATVTGSGALRCSGTAPSVTCTVSPGPRLLVA